MSASRTRKCLYIATFDPTICSTGTSTRGRLFLRALAQRYETHAVYLEAGGRDGRDEALVASLASAEGIPSSAWNYFVFSPRLLRSAARVLRDHDCDFVFADFEKAGAYAYLLSRRFGVPYVYNTHNVEYERYINVARTNRLRYALVPYMYAVEWLACRGADLTLAISESDAAVFGRWIRPSDLMVLPCAFDEDVINPFYDEPVSERPVVLMVGNYCNAGNRDAAFSVVEKILPAVVRARPDVTFRFVGLDFPPELERANVDIAGFVDDLIREYGQATLIIAPIEIGGGIKIKVIEALASGKYLLTTEKGMEGIDYSGMQNVDVIPTERFPDYIVAALNEPRPKTEANWTLVSTGFGSRRALEELCRRIDRLLVHSSAPLGAH